MLAAILSVKGAVYMLALAGVSVVAAQNGFPEATAELPMWGLLSLGFIVASLFLLANVQSAQEEVYG